VSARLRENGPALAAGLLLAAGLKIGYSRLGPDELLWMTGPTQRLVTLLTGIRFTYEAGYGYVNLSEMLVIAKSCAGVNYLLAVFGMLAFTLVQTGHGGRAKLLRVGVAAGCAYAVAVLTNAVRIAIGIGLHEWHVGSAWLTPERVHRLAGILVYVAALIGAQRMALCVLRVGAAPSTLGMPILWYLLITVAVPVANGALRGKPAPFLEHATWVLATLLAVCAVMWSVRGASSSVGAQAHRRVRHGGGPGGDQGGGEGDGRE
jgi:exosortase K